MLSYLGARRHFLSAEQEVKVLQEDYLQYKEESWLTIKQSMPAKVFQPSHETSELKISLHELSIDTQ